MSENKEGTLSQGSKREYYLDIARVLSMISVIMIHVSAISWYDGPFSIYPWGVINLFDIMSRYCVPVFLMISGYLFLDPGHNIPTRKIYTRYLPRLLTAFFFWSFLYAIITSGIGRELYYAATGGSGGSLLSDGSIRKFVHDLFWGRYHLWYMYVIVAMYLITPALRGLVSNRGALKFFLVASYIYAFLIPTIMMIPGVYDIFGDYVNRLSLQFISGYTFYYVAGLYIATEDFTPVQKKIIYALGAVGFAGTLITVTTYVLVAQFPDSVYHEYYTAGIPLFSLAVFLFFRERFAHVTGEEKYMKPVRWLSRMSFGVYMSHDFALMVFKKIGLTPKICTPFVSMPLLVLLDLCITLVVVWIFSLIPGLKKWVI